MRAIFQKPLVNAADAVQFVKDLHKQDLLFHFDDSPETIGNHRDGEWKRTFTDEEVPLINARVEELFELLNDPFELVIEVIEG